MKKIDLEKKCLSIEELKIQLIAIDQKKSELTVKEMKEICKALGIKGYYKMNKSQLKKILKVGGRKVGGRKVGGRKVRKKSKYKK